MKEIFVFGSNTQGRHGKGAAKTALHHHGARYRQSRGLQGKSYAIVTKELRKDHPKVTLEVIARQVEIFIEFATVHDDLTFNVTPIGCGLAGFHPQDIAPMFKDAPSNVLLPNIFKMVLAYNKQQS